MTIGDNIKRYRLAAGISQGRLAELIGKTRPSISLYESGHTIPPVCVIEKIADVLGVSKLDIIEQREHLSETEKELLGLSRSMNQQGQRQLMIYARGLAATYPKNQEVSQTA